MASKSAGPAAVPEVRKGQGNMQLTEQQFRERMRECFFDPAFEAAHDEIDRVVSIAWDAYKDARKSPRTRPHCSDNSLQTRDAVRAAQRRYDDPQSKSRVLSTSHVALDEDSAVQEEVRNAARALMSRVHQVRISNPDADERLSQPRPK
jgi:hypothetical protein